MTSGSQIPVFYINMEDAADRREWFEAQANGLGLEVTRVAAVVGRELPPEAIDRLKGLIQSGTPLGPSEIGCFLSHKKVWEQLLATGTEWAFIAEDDLHLAAGAAPYFHTTSWIPDDADVIKAETTFRRCHMSRGTSPSPDGRSLRQLYSLHGGSGGYFIRREAAEAALALAQDLCEPADHFLFNPESAFFNDHVSYQIEPAIAVQDLLRRENKAGFLESGLAIERRAQSKPKAGKILREIARPFRQLIQAIKDARTSFIKRTLFKRVDYRL